MRVIPGTKYYAFFLGIFLVVNLWVGFLFANTLDFFVKENVASASILE